MNIYLYVKTHNITGLKYLGKTSNGDPINYRGSGTYWMKHLKVHGYDVTTEIIKECKTNDEIKEWGIYYSRLWNVVESKEWANLCEESGDGGYRSNNALISYNKKPRSVSHKLAISNGLKNKIGNRSKPVQVESTKMIFRSITECAKFHQVTDAAVRYWIEKGLVIKI